MSRFLGRRRGLRGGLGRYLGWGSWSVCRSITTPPRSPESLCAPTQSHPVSDFVGKGRRGDLSQIDVLTMICSCESCFANCQSGVVCHDSLIISNRVGQS